MLLWLTASAPGKLDGDYRSYIGRDQDRDVRFAWNLVGAIMVMVLINQLNHDPTKALKFLCSTNIPCNSLIGKIYALELILVGLG